MKMLVKQHKRMDRTVECIRSAKDRQKWGNRCHCLCLFGYWDDL